MSSQRKPKKIAKIDVTYDLTSKFDVSQFLTFTSLAIGQGRKKKMAK